MDTYKISENGYYGDFGGAYVPEVLYKCIEELKHAYIGLLESDDFQNPDQKGS